MKKRARTKVRKRNMIFVTWMECSRPFRKINEINHEFIYQVKVDLDIAVHED